MKRNLLLLLLFLTAGVVNYAQTYEAFGTGLVDDSAMPGNANNNYQVINYNGEELGFYWTGLQPGAWGMVTIRLYFEGDDGDGTEFLQAYDETGTLNDLPDGVLLGSIGPNPGGDCAAEDSLDILIPASTFLTWASDDSITITMLPTFDIDQFCTNNWARVKLIYNYCSFGTPNEYAEITLSDDQLCPYDAPINLIGNLTPGTFSGTGVTGTTFDPTGLSAGNYVIYYIGTDSIGCTTDDYDTIKILGFPVIDDVLICRGDSAEFLPQTGSGIIWSTNSTFTGVIDTVMGAFSYGPLFTPTTLYAMSLDFDPEFMIDTMTALNFAVVDHDIISGDDKGGIAITPDFVFINGDNGVARFDVNLGSPSITLPVRDGLFSDLRDGKLWSLWNGTSDPSWPSTFTVTALRGLDSNMAFTSEYIDLQTPVTIGTSANTAGIFAGYGLLILYSGSDGTFYGIDMDNGNVEILGTDLGISYTYAENWSVWGVAEYMGNEHSIVFRSSSSGGIDRYNITTMTTTSVNPFGGDLSDMASFTYSPWNNRWYFHYEGSTGTFGGSSETLGYADATHNYSPGAPGGVGSCYIPVTATMNLIDLGPDTMVCENQTPLVIEAGIGYTSYTWNGINNNWNIYPVTASGQYIVDAIDLIGCHVIDTIDVTVDACLNIEESNNLITAVFPNPNNGNFKVQVNSDVTGTAMLEIFNMLGEKVYNTTFEAGLLNQPFPVQLNVNDGVYLVNLTLNDQKQTYRVIVQNN
jgi:hypothetical protein